MKPIATAVLCVLLCLPVFAALEAGEGPTPAPRVDVSTLTCTAISKCTNEPPAGEGAAFLTYKRLPITVMGSRGEGPVRMDVAPSFSAEPSPIVYLRLARAYQKLAADLAAANKPLWQELRHTDGRPLAAELDERVLRLHGLARIVYQEVGFRAQCDAQSRFNHQRDALRLAVDGVAGDGGAMQRPR
jgi:hypothetical protein